MDSLFAELFKQGILGLVTAIALWIAWRKDRQVQILYGRWIAKTETQTAKYHELATETTKTIQALAQAQQETREWMRVHAVAGRSQGPSLREGEDP